MRTANQSRSTSRSPWSGRSPRPTTRTPAATRPLPPAGGGDRAVQRRWRGCVGGGAGLRHRATDRFAEVTLKNVAATAGLELTPANTVVACSTRRSPRCTPAGVPDRRGGGRRRPDAARAPGTCCCGWPPATSRGGNWPTRRPSTCTPVTGSTTWSVGGQRPGGRGQGRADRHPRLPDVRRGVRRRGQRKWAAVREHVGPAGSSTSAAARARCSNWPTGSRRCGRAT